MENKIMRFDKNRLIEHVGEEREDLEATLDDIEAYGERFECPNCNNRTCDKKCFALSCFDWCLTHNHPSVEERDGYASVTVRSITEDANGQLVEHTEHEERRICGSEEAQDNLSQGNCNIVTSPFSTDDDDGVLVTAENQLWQFEHERYMGEVMGRESP